MTASIIRLLKKRLPKMPEQRISRTQSFVLLLLPCFLLLTICLMKENQPDGDWMQRIVIGSKNLSIEDLDGYLVWNPKCHMLSKDPMDPSIKRLVKKEKFEKCSKEPLLTSIQRHSNGTVLLVINEKNAKKYDNLTCCWASVVRPSYLLVKPGDKNFDSKISVGQCEHFTDLVTLDKSIEVVMVTCKSSKRTKSKRINTKVTKASTGTVYENVHAVFNPEKVKDHLKNNYTQQGNKPLSVLMLGLDSVSRLNFHRSMPGLNKYFDEKGWLELKGYNKMGDNTFPNLMAFLTGQNVTSAYNVCAPKIPYKLDNCSLIWYSFRDAGYITAYGEDLTEISTFNYLKVGFVDPPTDFYLRPYMLASEKLLRSKSHFKTSKYCTGPELSVERVFDFAENFSIEFQNSPYFGFFWTNAISHEDVNGPSSIDSRLVEKLKRLERKGVMNDSMIIILSDHGMRYGDIRKTFVGWYEERLPFIYIWVPEWFREQNPESYQSLIVNQRRLTSPYDLYETLRDILTAAGGNAVPSSGCPKCMSLFKEVPRERGCEDAGIASHWCACSSFQPESSTNKIVIEGAVAFIKHVESIVKQYKSKKGKRLCAELNIKRIHRADWVLNPDNDRKFREILILIEVTPGNAKYEVTVGYFGPGNYSVSDNVVSRINSYGASAKCLDAGMKQYCQCLK